MKRHSLITCLVFFIVGSINIGAQTTVTVKVEDFKFVPKDITITAGDTVKWVWVNGDHTTTSDSTAGVDSWDSPINQGNPTFSFVIKYPGKHLYHCKFHGNVNEVGMAGSITVLEPTSVKAGSFLPGSYKLEQNYPNPFNPVTEIKYSIPRSEKVSLAVFDIDGNKIQQLVNKVQAGGIYSVKFSSGNYASGVYFYRLRAGNFTDVKKMIILK